MKVAVIGLGRIGMPLAVQYADHVDHVIGVDIDHAVVASVNAGRPPFDGEVDLQDRLALLVRNGRLSGRLSATSAAAEADVVVVVVPLVVGEGGVPDFTSIDDATAAVGRGLRPGTLVAYETTVPVGTTRGRFVPSLEAESGLRSGTDFHVVFSPERVLTGRVFADLRRYPKLVGGLDEQGERKGMAFYEQVLEFDERPDLPRGNGVWSMGSAEAAEMAKLVETTYRDVNIALANEFALHAQSLGVDFSRVVDACNSQPYSHIHRPGIAVGGHCIPVYPHLYLENDPDAVVVRTSRAANEALPARWIGVLEGVTGPLAAKHVAVLGAGFRGDVRETAFSGVHPVVRILSEHGANVRVHDPLLSDEDLRALGFEPFHRGMSADVVVVQADHAEYRVWSSTDVPGVAAVLDGRGILDLRRWPGLQVVSVLGRSQT